MIIGASLFAAFPAVYAVFLSAFYLPVLLLLFGLISVASPLNFATVPVACDGSGIGVSSSVLWW